MNRKKFNFKNLRNMLLRKSPPNLNEVEYLNAVNNLNNNDHIAEVINANNGQLQNITPVEIHPYSYTEYDLGYDKMIIGTFPPISYILDHHILNQYQNLINLNNKIINRPLVPFFHGNRGGMWDVLLNGNYFEEILQLPRNYRKKELIDELIFRFIRYDDIIYSTKRKITKNKYSAEDQNLFNIVPKVSLIKDILNKKGLNAILFNTSTTFSKNIKLNNNHTLNIESNNNLKSFDLFIRTLQEQGYKVDFMLDDVNHNVIIDWIELNYINRDIIKNNFKFKMIFKVRIKDSLKILQEFYVVTPFSPAARGKVDLNPIISNWLNNNPFQNRYDLLKDIYSSFSLFSDDEEFFIYKNFLYSLNYYAQ